MSLLPLYILAKLPCRAVTTAEVHMVEAADVVVIGRVISIGFIGPTIEATDDHRYHGTWRLVKAEAECETLLKGDLPGTTLEFFYYYMSTGPVSGDGG